MAIGPGTDTRLTKPTQTTVKVRMQARPDAFNGPIQCLLSTLREEGVRALWKGSVPALVRAEMRMDGSVGLY